MLILLILSLFLPGSDQTNESRIDVTITGIDQPNKGKIYIALWETEKGFPKEFNTVHYLGQLEGFGKEATYSFDRIPYGKYAVTIVQDKNKNGKIDTNFIGIPAEPVGAYNKTGLGRLSYSKSVLVVDQASHAIRIEMLND